MTSALLTLWQSRSPRERQAWRVVLALLALCLCAALLAGALGAREPLRRDVAALRADTLRMQQQSLELAQLRAATPPPADPRPLRAMVQSSLDGAALSSSLASLEAPDPEHVVVVFSAVAFADWLQWLEALAARQVRLESCRVEALPTGGMVGVTVTLVRTTPP